MSSFQDLSYIERSQLSFKLVTVSIRELLYLDETPCDIYGISFDGLFDIVLTKGNKINRDLLQDLINEEQTELFIYRTDKAFLVSMIQKVLTQSLRSLSVGNTHEKVKTIMNLLTIHMGYVYESPTNDEILKMQHQYAKGLSKFLLKRIDLHEGLYNHFIKQKHHFVFAQPFISSLFLLGALKHSAQFSDKEIETLFLVSYFKDIGMAAIPVEKYIQDNLNHQDKILLSNHAKLSAKILKGRLPFIHSHLMLIKNHHFFGLLNQEIEEYSGVSEDEDQFIAGFETMMVSVVDIIAAMISGRPFRAPTSLFDSLNLVKDIIADDHPREFRMLVTYFKKFFLNAAKI